MGKRLVVCCDGTWNRADWEGGTATNVVRLLRAVRPQARAAVADAPEIPQITYYHPGVGTGNRVDRLLGGGLGLGLSQNVRDAYAFLVNNYAPGDEIFLFGFSRGAFTARSIAGLIGAIGLLHPTEMGRFTDAWCWTQVPRNQRDVNALDTCFPRRTRDVPIVFLTAARDELGDIVRGYGVGAVDYVLKPFEPELLRSKVAVFAELEASRRAVKR